MLRLYVQSTIPDARAEVKKKQFSALGIKSKIGMVCLADCYTIDCALNKKQTEKAKILLANPLAQEVSLDADVVSRFIGCPDKITAHKWANYKGQAQSTFSYAIEIGFLPGVTDNIGHTAKETLADGAKIKFKDGQNVYSSAVFFVLFKPERSGQNPRSPINRHATADIQKIANSLYNPLIQKATITSAADFKRRGDLDFSVPKVKLSASSKVSRVNLNVGDEELIKLGKLGIPDSVIARRSASDDEAILFKSRKKIAASARQSPQLRQGFVGQAGLLAMTLRRGPLALSLEELKAIRDYFKRRNRRPTDIELEMLAQTWSEHCKHTIFNDPIDELKDGLYKTYIKKATEVIRRQKTRTQRNKGNPSAALGFPLLAGDFCVSVFTDNAGGISFDEDNIIAYKVETHNTPSALDPFGGSITGLVGVNRDALGFGLGAKPIANFYGFCLADPNDKAELYRDKNLRQPMLSSRRIMDGVIAGINSGGNQSGIPTPLGFLYFDDRFRGKPLVFAGTLGLIPKKIGNRLGHVKKARPGDLIVTVGGRVGADGIHGATFSSEGLSEHSPATAVQIGDPITQKKFSDAICKEIRDMNLYNSITDCGAGGLSSAVGETAEQAGGCEVYLDKVPLKYPGLAPWQIWISESQERMVLAVPPAKWKKFEKLMEARGVEAAAIGKFTAGGNCVVKYGGKTILDIKMDFLRNGRPKKHLKTEKPTSTKINHVRKLEIGNWKLEILRLLASANITSSEFVSTQYDHEVQGGSALKPLQGAGRVNGEASVIRPLLNSQKGVVLSYGLAPELSEVNPYAMAGASIDSAIRAAVAAGANVDYLALLDNFCWCSPDDRRRLWQLKEAARACYDFAVAFGTPFISGKDSMYNDFKGFSADGQPLKISIPPTLLISAVGVIPDVTKAISLDAKLPGDLIYILGDTDDDLKNGNVVQARGLAPAYVNAQKNLSLYRAFYKAAQKNLIASAISINRGGMAIALAKNLIGGNLGAEIGLKKIPGNWQENSRALFSESQGRILAGINPKKSAEFEKIMRGNIFAKIGHITARTNLNIIDKSGKKVVQIKTSDMTRAYKSTFKNY